jgi:hypothetical protein
MATCAASINNSGPDFSSRGTRSGASPATRLIAIVFTFNLWIEMERKNID